jgi:hypothetical protein
MSRNAEPPVTRRSPTVLDPAWEDELRAAQAAEGEAGSVDAELAVIHLLRHARAPEPLAAADLDRLWTGEIAPAIAPLPWWRRRWLWGVVPAAATAALMIIVLRDDPEGSLVATSASPPASEALIAAAGPPPSPARALEQQFAQLEGDARRELGADVDRGRGVMRSQLLAMASAGDKP